MQTVLAGLFFLLVAAGYTARAGPSPMADLADLDDPAADLELLRRIYAARALRPFGAQAQQADKRAAVLPYSGGIYGKRAAALPYSGGIYGKRGSVPFSGGIYGKRSDTDLPAHLSGISVRAMPINGGFYG